MLSVCQKANSWQFISRIQNSTRGGVDAPTNIIKDRNTPPSPRVSAARAVFEMATKAVELDELTARIETLKRYLKIAAKTAIRIYHREISGTGIAVFGIGQWGYGMRQIQDALLPLAKENFTLVGDNALKRQAEPPGDIGQVNKCLYPVFY